MPNTLAHLGVQGLTTRALLREPDLKWIYVGCIIPDLPWIAQRVLKIALPCIDAYDLRLYAVVQASFFSSLLLSLALAALSLRFWRTFTVLALNAFLHLLLDACQIKWANGVHFLAPFDWRFARLGLFWPESLPTYLLTAIGLVFVVWNWQRSVGTPFHWTRCSGRRLFTLSALVAAYVLLPLFLLDGPEKADNHFVGTLRARDDRPGRQVEFDRNLYLHDYRGGVLRTFAGEELGLSGLELEHSAKVSLRGIFTAEDQIHVREYHVHMPWFRDAASCVGLLLIASIWIAAILRERDRKGDLARSSP